MAYFTDEQKLLNSVIGLAESYGILWFHDYDSRKNPPGFPDLVLVGKQHVLFAELKAQNGQTGRFQAQWKYRLMATGAHYALWRPSDLELGRIESTLENL